MNLNPEAIKSAMNHRREVEKYGINAADFFSVINYDNIILILDKVEILENEVINLKNENAHLRSEVGHLRTTFSKK